MENLPSFQKILIAVDDSKYSYRAAAYGFTLARKLYAEVGLVHINEFPVAANMTGDPLLGDPGIVIPNLLEIQKESSQKLMHDLKQEFGAGLEVKEFILEGNVTDEVIRTAKDFQASLIVMGTHSRTGLSHFLSGSVAESISRHSICPVLIVPSRED
jgi:nucleotide-binding universal stress UspA family protein